MFRALTQYISFRKAFSNKKQINLRARVNCFNQVKSNKGVSVTLGIVGKHYFTVGQNTMQKIRSLYSARHNNKMYAFKKIIIKSKVNNQENTVIMMSLMHKQWSNS